MTLNRMRLSVLWHQDLMDSAPLALPRVLDRYGTYSDVFAGSATEHDPFTPPWPGHSRQGFWEWYLRRPATLAAIGARTAWRALIPLRFATPLSLDALGGGVTVISEGLLHPWGASLVVTFAIDGKWPDFGAAIDRLRQLRREPCLVAAEGEAARPQRLDEVAIAGLARLREKAMQATPGRTSEAFSVFSLLRADGDRSRFDPTREDAARFLHAATSFSDTWEHDALPELAKANVAGISAAPASHLI